MLHIQSKYALYLWILNPLILTQLVQASDEKNEFLSDFIVGEYLLIGKALNSNESYVGEMKITESNEKLNFVKTIGQMSILGEVAIEYTHADQIKVIRLSFKTDHHNYEETCLMDVDLDNYARFTCHLYQKGVTTDNPGLEAMFIKNFKPTPSP